MTSSRTKVLIAADSSATSVEAARVAHSLFGDAAEYLVVNVDSTINDAIAWGAAYPMVMPLPLVADDPAAYERAARVAAEVARSADLETAQSFGEIGDPASAIIEAAHEHDVDVIVVGSHKHNWFSQLFTGSVTRDLVREADIPVLVVK